MRCGYYLLTHTEALGDAAIAMFRSWLIERLGPTGGAREQDTPLPALQG
jgi:hypothetical protein